MDFYPTPYYKAKVLLAALFTIVFITYVCLNYPDVHSLPNKPFSKNDHLIGTMVWVEKEGTYGTIVGFAVINGIEYPMIETGKKDLKFITESPKKEDM